ncbi:MAG: MFS transporter [Candidatus Lokiarchaeota archaeon]|nr:MFS transporter [Candidatus Harpocratesius repetitus]
MANSQEENLILQKIRREPMMWKFQFYGFFKNLQFFEPFIYLIFISWGYSLFQIGILMLIREVITYVFEIPSGILADNFGKKTELLICFTFYILAFISYFLGPSFIFLAIGSVLYGLGEAFRSGTHKAMEMDWMEKNQLLDYKSFIYGRSRSWSLYGSALNSILAAILIFIIPADRWIFLVAIIPFLADFVLISTYPKYMNSKTKNSTLSIKALAQESIKNIKKMLKTDNLRKSIFSSATYDATFKGIKDYIQPIMALLIIFIIRDLQLDSSKSEFYTHILLSSLYAIFYLISSFSSKNAYSFRKLFKDEPTAYNFLFDVFGVFLLAISIFLQLQISLGVIILYLLIYMIYNLRRPILIGYIGNLAGKDERATVLSVESQTKSIFSAIFAPLFGWIADFSIPLLFLLLGIFTISINWGIFRRNFKNPKKD